MLSGKGDQLPEGIVKICRGVALQATLDEALLPGEMRRAVAEACGRVGPGLFGEDEAGAAQQRLLAGALLRNLGNRKAWPYEELAARWSLGVSYCTFCRLKRRLCWDLARELGLVGAVQSKKSTPAAQSAPLSRNGCDRI